MDYDLHCRAPGELVADARRKAPGLGLGGVVRLALARFAGWSPDQLAALAPPGQLVSMEGASPKSASEAEQSDRR